MSERKPEGKFIMRCSIHGVPYSVFYARDGFHYDKEKARERIEEFRMTHCMFSPDCRDSAVIEDVFNAGAYTHTSVALHDAIKGANATVIELHITNVHAREPFRHHSYLSPAARGIVVGFGVQGYPIAMHALVRIAAS